jgi:TorA maturation chaperone TorD
LNVTGGAIYCAVQWHRTRQEAKAEAKEAEAEAKEAEALAKIKRAREEREKNRVERDYQNLVVGVGRGDKEPMLHSGIDKKRKQN